ncbi:uncharacterized protein SPPG_05654 [Spizellomyces punctatus DAOM BR117]|uniref:AB hydrolase-1 domain-containing protein n=1 Tax=Spizellomyces punctatus (strain DAOM BR117) TaxID=645134 RepID=A0A0L0HF47_SPIPD|nr:uncharacterized protein SPPG_05654 [Spizellomyces punctatus DAOM BR117]KNC99413.1 hypothetical protein SPPG_05654 [Spizellomyces punctatus DAOM BR117]|eukprot:XP_016607453.1 hypothetical protein SPPG_05654 [Spizellomyces punctatus DAOM BR117]
MPVGHGPLRYLVIRALAFAIDCIAPVSIAYTLYALVNHYNGTRHGIVFDGTWTNVFYTMLLPIWFVFETAFYVWMLWQRQRFQAMKDVPGLDNDRRRFMFGRMLKTISQRRFPHFLATQFMWKDCYTQLTSEEIEEVYMDNVKEWAAWAFFSKPSWKHVLESPNGKQLALEGEEMIDNMAFRKGIVFQEGYNEKIRTVTISYNPVEAFPKPLLLYAVVALLEFGARCIFRMLGFQRYPAHRTDLAPDMPERGITYWLRMPKGNTVDARRRRKREESDLPIVFIHGLGGGLWCYLKFIGKLWWTQSARPIYLVELPHVSMRLVQSSPDPDTTVRELVAMLRRHAHDSATFIGHSLGSAYVAYMINHTKAVAGVVMIDPVCFNIYDANLLYNFVHRRPGAGGKPLKANEFLVYWLVSRELYISQWISRQFLWYRAHCLTSSLPSSAHIFLAGKDNIIDTSTVKTYLDDHDASYTYYENLDHAQFLLSEKIEWEIVDKIGSVCKNAAKEWGRKSGADRRRRRMRR